jgi:PAS domain S-box-containing protein
MLSFRAKLLILVTLAVAATAALALPAIHRFSRLENEAALRALEMQALMEGARLAAVLGATETDVRTLALTREILAMLEAPDAGTGRAAQRSVGKAAGGGAPDVAELAAILHATLDHEPSWRDIRLTSLADPGRVLFRASREPALDIDGDPGAPNARSASPDAVSLAPLTEGTSAILVPGGGALGTLRLAAPVRAVGHQPGLVIVDIDLARLFLTADERVADAGQPMGRGSIHLTVLPEADIASAPAPDARLSPGADNPASLTAEALVGIGSGQERVMFRVLASAGPGAALSTANASVAPYISAALAIAMLGMLFAHHLTAPLSALSRSLATGRADEAAVARHLEASDEIGAIARAVHALGGDLVESTGRFATIFRHAPVGIVSCGVDGTILDMNPEAEAMFGFAPGAALGRSLDILMPAAARGLHHARLAAFDEHSIAMNADRDVAGLRQDGTEFPLSVTLGSVSVGQRKTIIGILRDVSERHEAEEKLAATLAALEASTAELERSNGELDQFAYIASHDLKAPLRVIDNASLWLEEDLAEFLTDDTRESMDLLRSRVHRMERLLDDLLAYSRVGRVEHRTTLMPGTEILEKVVALVSPPEGFRVEGGPGLDAVLLPDMPISGVLLNLVSNAIKHHDRSEGLVRVTVEDLGASYAFAVEDDGPGIPEEYRERVFGMFQTLKPRDEVEGSGMGLAFVRKTVASVNGTLNLSAKSDRGCVFRFTWPKPADEPEEDAAA